MVGDVAVYLLSGLGAQGIVVAGHEAVLIHKGDVPKGHVADDVMLYGNGLVLVDAWDMNQKGLASIFTNAHHSPREIYVMEIVLHSWDVLEPVLFRITCPRALVFRRGDVEAVTQREGNATGIVVLRLAEHHAITIEREAINASIEKVIA